MNKKKVATNIPADLLDEATKITGLNQTSAIVEGLRELIRKEKRRLFLSLEAGIPINYDVKKSRSRG